MILGVRTVVRLDEDWLLPASSKVHREAGRRMWSKAKSREEDAMQLAALARTVSFKAQYRIVIKSKES